MIVSIIAALSAADRAIGLRGDLPWRLPADLARFKRLTMGHTLIMGRRTYQSLGGRTLPGRRIVVLTHGGFDVPAGVERASSLEEALDHAREEFGETEAFIAGGAEVYRQALERDIVDRMYLTLVNAEVEADVFFPAYAEAQWEVVEATALEADQKNPYALEFLVLKRK